MIIECPGCKSRYDVTGRPPGTLARCRCGETFPLPEPETRAGALDCPKCGGSVAATNHACEFCGAALLVKACPRCFSRMFHGAKHCVRCGCDVVVPARATPDGDAEPRHCPRCETPELVGRLVDDVLLDECPDCYGIYLDSNALERIIADRRGARADTVLGATPRKTLMPTPEGPAYVKCPDCDTRMNRRIFAPGSGVVIDVCRAHGTWFDANELPQVIEFCMQGGLEAVARREIEKANIAKREARQAQLLAATEQDRPGNAMADPTRMSLSGQALNTLLKGVGWLLSR
ncbi:zf-TFIIB domain-containing protein [Haliangium ochraceum]|uniref:Transcription factor zinc-finger domain-containing protein n=1 Tax=Haliangium ochraceum (strain DSM 14365 / JCM 11303 / SMP-2) TaxID=502025 RepID=D0LRG2_HALO1|nr:zf-TFIIB domain-containing protein [Haliangium ochraceum]ACY17190.1 hypothetical protein Hoch_4700 [Haliangium ochraceum DSM 14365]